jgi:2-succinyl-5-enolpyruvyl-6-hydroxy-3-cyclohexene-1-carboxylate synthase
MMGVAETGFVWAWHLVDGLAAAGVERAVISPGARSTPLALAALRHPDLTSEMVVDERSAGFVALGMAKATGLPVVLIATSGSAIANWLPAVVEADMARVPLVLLSADRPPELHDCGANQTMDQTDLFGCHVRASHSMPPPEAECGWLASLAAQVVALCLGPLPGPVHINVPFREPLVPLHSMTLTRSPRSPARHRARQVADPAIQADLSQILSTGPGAIICGPEDLGDGFRDAVTDLARRLAVPVLADVLSGLRFGDGQPTILSHPDQVARTAPQPAWLLRFGTAPVTRAVGDWIAAARGRPQIVVASHSRLADPWATATHVVTADPEQLCRSLDAAPAAQDWLRRFQTLDAAAAQAAEAACGDDVVFEGAVMRALMRALPRRMAVFLGNSLAVRSVEWFGGTTSSALRMFGNRGLSGIDGNLSTAIGIATALGACVAIVGDLAALHDLNALAWGRGRRLVVVLLDNGGGGIFDHLPQSSLPEFERGWVVPQEVDWSLAARAFGLSYVRALTVASVVAEVGLGLERGEATLIHVPIDRSVSLGRCRALFNVGRS